MEGMVMQLLAGSKLLDVDQSVKDRALQNEWLRRRVFAGCFAFTDFQH